MQSVRLRDLPVVHGKTGWPWDEESPPLPASDPDSEPWVRISLVMPSYNQGGYLEEAIRSVLLQNYPNLEFIVMDGGSTDDSLAIIRKYSPWLTAWVSERDAGQSAAINKGFARSTGEIFNWLCSDDLLRPGALERVARTFREDPNIDVVAGNCYCLYQDDPSRNGVQRCHPDRFERSPCSFAVWQPSCFYRRRLIARKALLREDLHYCMDRELWCYFRSRGARWTWRDDVLSVNRFTGANKSLVGKDKVMAELDLIYRSYFPDRLPVTFWLHRVWLPLVRSHKQHPSSIVRTFSRWLSRGVSLSLHAVYGRDRVKALQDEYYMYGLW